MTTRSFSTFLLDDQLFGLDILLIREINKHLDLSPVPHSPEYIKGLINLRGQIVTVFDLKQRLGLGNYKVSPETHNIIIKTDTELADIRNRQEIDPNVSLPDKIGLIVDGIGDVVTVSTDEIEPPPANTGMVDRKYLSGVLKLENNLITLLNINSVLIGVN